MQNKNRCFLRQRLMLGNVCFDCDVQGNRISYNGLDYKAAFTDERSKEALKESEEQLSLFDLVAVNKNPPTSSFYSDVLSTKWQCVLEPLKL